MKISFCLAALAVVAGCASVHSAREAQRQVEGRIRGERIPVAKVSLAGSSLARLVDFAMTNRPSVRAAALAVEDARLALQEIAAAAPLVSKTPWNALDFAGSLKYDESSRASTSLRARTSGSAAAELSLDLLIYDFGRNAAEAEAQAHQVLAAEQTLTDTGYTVFEEVACAYFSLLEADTLVAVALTNESEYAEHLRQAEERLKAGEAQQLDVTRAKLDLAQAEQQTVSASNTVICAGAELMRALGIDAERGTRDEVYPARPEALAVLQGGFDATDYSVATAFAEALTNAPETAVARAQLAAAKANVDAAVADFAPSISASVALNWTDPLWLWRWSFSAVERIFHGGDRQRALDRAVVAMQRQAAEVDRVEQELSAALETAIAERDNAAEAQRTAVVSVHQARENLDLVKERYLAGDASRVDYTDSVSDYASALGSRVSAFYRGQRAEAKLFALIGRTPQYHERPVEEKGE